MEERIIKPNQTIYSIYIYYIPNLRMDEPNTFLKFRNTSTVIWQSWKMSSYDKINWENVSRCAF